MWCSKVHITLLLFELHFIALDCHPKPEKNNIETFEIKQLPGEVVEFINTKPDEPVIREIFFYHIVEKPYLKKSHKTSPDNQEPDFDESIRPFTNGQGYQFFDSQSKDPMEKDADDKDIKKRDFSIDTNDTTIPIHVGKTNVERNLDKNKKTEDESTKTTENEEQSGNNRRKRDIEYQPVMDHHRSVIYTNSPKNMNAENKPFKNKVRNMFNNLPSAKQRHTYGMSLHNGFGNMWNNIQSLPFINKIGSLFTTKLHNEIEIPIKNKKDMEPVVKENPLPPYITNLKITAAPKILEPTNIKPDTKSKPNTSMEEQFVSSNVLSTNKTQDSFKDSSSEPEGFTSEKNEIRPGKIYVNENQKRSNDDSNELPESNDLTDDTKEAFVNQNNINLSIENKIDEAPKDNLQSDVDEIEINPIPIKTSPKINDNTKENNEDIGNNKHSSFYEKLKKSFKNLLNKLPFKQNPLRENKVNESIGPKKIPTRLNENNSGTYGMSLKNNAGFVWNDLDSKHATFINVGETPLVDKRDHIPTEPNAEPTDILSHFNDNIVKPTSLTTTTKIHTNKQTDSIKTTYEIPTNTENTFTTNNLEITPKIKLETNETMDNNHTITKSDSTTASDMTTPKLTTMTTDTKTYVPETSNTTTEVIKSTANQSAFNKTEITTDNKEITTTKYGDTLANLTTTVDIKNQTHVSDSLKTTDVVLTTTEVIKTTAKQITFNKTELTTDNNEITTTEYGDTVTNTTTTNEANTKIDNTNQVITTQSSSTTITTGPQVSKTDFESTTTITRLNKTSDKISEPNAKKFTETSKSNVTTESPEVNNSTTEAQSKNIDDIDTPKNDTKSHLKGESIKSDLNKLLEKKVFWDWLSAWTSAYFDVLDESVKDLVREEVALELKNITELIKNKHNDETGISPTASRPEINSTKTNEIRKSQDDSYDHITTSKPSVNTSDIETSERKNPTNYSSVNIAGDTINGKSVDVTNIFIFMNDKQDNTLKPIVNKYIKYVNDTNKKITESTDNVTVVVTTTSRTLISEKDDEKTMSNDTSSLTNKSHTTKYNTDSSLISATITSAASEITSNKIPATENSTNSDGTTEKILTTIHKPNLAVPSPLTQINSSEKTADSVILDNINVTTISNNLATETISTTSTIDKTSTIKSISVTEPLITTKSANISTKVTTLTSPLENTMTTTQISPITTESSIGNVNTTKVTTQTVSSSSSDSATATTISNNLATETTLTTIDLTSTIKSTSVTKPLTTAKSVNISTEVTVLTTPLQNTMTTTEISPITTESRIGNLSTTKITTQTVSSNTPTSATETLKADSTITTTTTDRSTTSLNKKYSNQTTSTTTPALQNNSNEQNSTTLNNTTNSTTEGPTTISTSSTEATTSDMKIGVNATTEASIVNATLMNSTIKETNSSGNSTATVSGKDINLTTEVTTIKESTNNTETPTTHSEPHPTTEGPLANNSAIKDSLPNITTAVTNSTMNFTESSTLENSNSTDSKATQDTKTTTEKATQPTTISTTVLDKVNTSDTTTSPNKR
ncbi:unnamed protein product [Pieris brassicae]|uniref:Uncharacterized protein n=1 Tax=Pieris brassicae TaxID=7116 RepID=A0A9P0THK4_PIEBR|nr:unnamed protein product [Pieris brassicae]